VKPSEKTKNKKGKEKEMVTGREEKDEEYRAKGKRGPTGA